MKRNFAWPMLLLITFCLVGCGTFQLAGGIGAPIGKTADQQQNDILFCKDQARMESESAGQQTKDFLLGMTIIGAPIAIEQNKSLQREVFAKCMTAKGYSIAPVQPEKAGPIKATGTDIQHTAVVQSEQLFADGALVLRTEASLDADTGASVRDGERLNVIRVSGDHNDWINVSTSSGQTGWVLRSWVRK